MKRKFVINSTVLFALLVLVGFVFAGSLEPTAGPGSTMKTLDEIEPRTPISQADIPLTIGASGSYYLTEDVSAAGTAITVGIDDVTIDLGGFSLIGPNSDASYGIYMFGRKNVEIRNGTIRNFDYAIYEYSAYTGKNHRVINVRVKSNKRTGINLKGSGHLVKDCTVTGNGNSATSSIYGIFVENGTVIDNTVSENGDSAYTVSAIHVSNGVITGNTVSGNGSSAGNIVYPIYIAYGSVTGNTVYNNGDSSGGIYMTAIRSGGRGTISFNTVFGNGKSSTANIVRGIQAGTGCSVIGNTVTANGELATSTVIGINLLGNNLVDQNTAFDNGLGGTGSVTNMSLGVAGCVYGNNVAP